MEAATLEQRISALQAEDDVIRQRLAELDAKLTTWLAAIGQEPLVIEPEPAAVETEPAAGQPEPTVPEEEAVAGADEPGTVESPVAETREPEPEPEPPADVLESAPEVAPEPESDEEGAAAAAAASAEDEALLATLDEETANAIRVRRRISRGRRSVQELLEEIQSTRPSAKGPGPQRKRWWRSRNE